MPSKDRIKIFFFVLISMSYANLAGATPEVLGSDFSSEMVKDPGACRGWQRELDKFSINHLCVVTVRSGDERPRYVQNLGSETYRFLFSQESLALVVDVSFMAELRASSAIRSRLLVDLTSDRMELWHHDAIYWWKWLQKSEQMWSGGD